MKAIGLVRVSSQAQELESQSLKVKEAILKDGFKEEDIVLIEDKESGLKGAQDRSGLMKLRDTINNDQVSAVYAYELSRISRKVDVVYSIRDFLMSHNVNLIILNPYFRLLKDDGTLSETASIVFSIFAGLSEQETYLRVERTMRGKQRKKAEGKLTCGKPLYGYALQDDHVPVPDPAASQIVKEAFRRFLDGESSGVIAKDFYLRKEFPDCLHMSSARAIVSHMLANQTYAGTPIYPPLVSREEWERAQELKASARKHYFKKTTVTKGTYLLHGLLFSPSGHRLIPSVTNNRYITYNEDLKESIKPNLVCTDELAKYVISKYLSSGILANTKNQELQLLNQSYNLNVSKLKGIDPKVTLLKGEIDRINSRIIKGRLSEEKGDKMIDDIMEQIYNLEDKRQDLLYQNSQLTNRIIYVNSFMYDGDNYSAGMSKQDLYDALHKYVDKVVVSKPKYGQYVFDYMFKDGTAYQFGFYSINRVVKYFDKDGASIDIE